MAKVIIDAGHGGQEPGAIYNGRREKDDNLRLAMAVGRILEENGVQVAYTRTDDVYQTPFEKAQSANREGGDFLISIHRNSSPLPNQYSGAETLIFDRSGEKVELAENINRQLEEAGFRNLGIQERPGLVILRRSRMPAVLVEAGFLNTDADNALFDENFQGIAQAIADGVLETLGMRPEEEQTESSGSGEMQGQRGTMAMQQEREFPEEEETVYLEEEMERDGRCCPCMQGPVLYRVQTGAFRNRANAENMLYQLLQQNYPAYILMEDGLYKVQVGAYRQLDNAVRMEQRLRRQGYATFLTT